MKQPIFIVGVPRSGTTLVRLILNSHSRIAIAPETHFFRHFWSHRDMYGDLQQDANLQAFWDDFSNSKYFQDFRFKDVQRICDKIFSGERTYKDIFSTLLVEYAKQNGKIRCGEKTPDHLEFAKTILDLYPDAKIIHVIRDPRDVALSFKRIPWGSNYVFSNARLWNRYMDIPKKQNLISNSGSYLELIYEDLVTNSKEMIKVICSFIHEEPEDGMHKFYQSSERYIEKNEPWKNKCLQPLTSSYIGKWKDELSNWEIEQIVIKCGQRMIEKGYIQRQTNISFRETLILTSKKLLFHCLWFFRAILNKIRKFFMSSLPIRTK